MKKNALIFNILIYYRIEQRTDAKDIRHPTIRLSYRDSKNKSLHYLHPPRRISQEDAKLLQTQTNDSSATALYDISPKLTEDFCRGFVGLNGDKNRLVRRKGLELPLGVLLMADAQLLLETTYQGASVSDATIDDRRRAINTILKFAGTMCWYEVTPSTCADWLAALSEHMRRTCVWVLKTFFRVQMGLKITDENPWSGYRFETLHRKPQNAKGLIDRNLEYSMLPDCRCRELITACFENLDKPKYTMFAGLLMMTLGLSLDELCALTYGNFYFLPDYPQRLIVSVSEIYTKPHHQKKHRLVAYDEPYKRRILPVSLPVADYYKVLESQAKIDAQRILGDENAYVELPVFPSQSGRKIRMTPTELHKKMNDLFTRWAPTLLTDTPKISPRPIVALLRNTAIQNLRKTGVDEEVVRRFCGKSPKIVSARCYQDFQAPTFLNRLGAQQDQWFNHLYPGTLGKYTPQRLGAKLQEPWVTDEADCRTCVHARIELKSYSPEHMPSDLVSLSLGAVGGVTATITFILPEKDEKEGDT